MTKRRPKITLAQSDQIAGYREAGRSYQWIANRLDLSEGAVSWHCLTRGIEPPNPRPVRADRASQEAYRRGAHLVRLFSPEEDRRLLDLEATGITLSEIARRLDRRRNTIAGRLATLARRDERMFLTGSGSAR